MSKLLLALLFSLITLISFAHRGDFASIENVVIVETETSYIYNFQFENIQQKALKDVTIELVINSKPVQLIEIKTVKKGIQFVDGQFTIQKVGFDIELDIVQIEVTQLFGKRNDWGGWDSPNYLDNLKQTNTLFSETYADAPWRMKKTDQNGNINTVPVHVFIHDADKVIGTKPQVDYVNIRLKNASANAYGPKLTFNSLSDPAYKAMFSSTSPNDTQLNIKEFKLNSFIKSPNYTIDFNEESDLFGDNFVRVKQPYWYFTFNIPASALAGMENTIDIQVEVSFSNFAISDDVIGLRVFRSDDDIPSLTDWYRGDTHLHSLFTQNSAEIGLPIEATIEAGERIGLDWFASTDHTSDYDNYGGGNIQTNWNKIREIVKNLNLVNPNFKVIAAQEVATSNAQGKLVHMLAYPNYNAPFSLPFLSDGHGDLTTTTSTINKVVSILQNSQGFSYAAHPFATADKLPTVPVGGGIWNLGEISFPANGSSFPETGGVIIANETNASSDILSLNENEFIKDRIKGAQIWNVRNGRQTSSSSVLDPWNTMGGSSIFNATDSVQFTHHVKKFRQGQEVVNHINKLGLIQRNSNEDLTNWKMYISAGADAHGSFNFSNTDDFGGFGDLNTNAIGKLTTVVYAPKGMGDNGENLLEALYNGNSTLSDGPIATIGISSNGNDTENEIYMGQDTIVNSLKLNNYFLNLNYVTTPEFGDFTNLKIIAGTEDGEIVKSFYLPYSNGSRSLSYSLDNLLDSIFGTTVIIPQEKYFYIRAELQTYKDYTATANIYRSNYDIYHSFTNPIWMKLVEIEDVTEFEINAYPNPFKGDFSLVIKNPTDQPVKVNLYNDIGQLVSSTLHNVNGVQTVVIPTDRLQLAKGMYTVRASVLEHKATEKVYKIQ